MRNFCVSVQWCYATTTTKACLLLIPRSVAGDVLNFASAHAVIIANKRQHRRVGGSFAGKATCEGFLGGQSLRFHRKLLLRRLTHALRHVLKNVTWLVLVCHMTCQCKKKKKGCFRCSFATYAFSNSLNWTDRSNFFCDSGSFFVKFTFFIRHIFHLQFQFVHFLSFF